jgi:hypothetical protein
MFTKAGDWFRGKQESLKESVITLITGTSRFGFNTNIGLTASFKNLTTIK